ncbi:nucleotide exchange factor GrpE [Candidatus Saccharibacteria bacterium]|nr:nucleotide exchange factor GrpE [Candidatus Saccharibacteria bacterium]
MKSDKNPKPAKKAKPFASRRTAAEYEQQIGELTIHLQRLQAEFENYKKREAAQKAELMNGAKEAVLAELLPALDNFDRAATHLPAELENNAWAKGMQYVGQQLIDLLDSMGVHKFAPQTGEQFNAARHDALDHIKSKKPADTIVEVVTPGYEINQKVVRAATVKVSKGE